jgi:anti-anti-sigma factor
MNHSFQSQGNSGILSLCGSLTIENIAQLKSAVSEALQACDQVTIDVSGVESADICSLQLFCSAHRTVARSGRVLELAGAGEGFESSISEAGYGRHVQCVSGNSSDCLWADRSGEKRGVAP